MRNETCLASSYGICQTELDFKMGKTSQVTETLALAISAVKKLNRIRGSTSRDICNYITKAHKDNKDAVRKQVKTSLKRGLAYGILKRDEGHYDLCTEADDASKEIASQEIALIDMRSRKRGGGGGVKRGSKKIRKSRRRSSNNCKRCGKSCPCAAGACQNRKYKCNKGSTAPVKAVIDTGKLEVEKLFGHENLRKIESSVSLSSKSTSFS